MSQITLEQRVAALENQVAELKRNLDRAVATPDWFDRIIGSMKDKPGFEEVVKLGHEIRQAEPPWAKYAGSWREDDPVIEEWKQAVEEYRRKMDEDPDVL